ncbi:HEAT repeat domain-containing protein [Actinoplanes sp. NPDC000266]
MIVDTGQAGDALVQRISNSGRSPEEYGEDAYALLQEIFRGYSISRLKALLSSENIPTAEAGIWVLSELGSKAAPLLGDIAPLLRSPSRKVRYWAIDVVHSSAGPDDGDLIGKALSLLDDDDPAVRRAVIFFLSRISDAQLSAAIDRLGEGRLTRLLGWFRRVIGGGFESEILERLQDEDGLGQRVAVAAAARIPDRGGPALQWAAAEGPDDVSVFASREVGR